MDSEISSSTCFVWNTQMKQKKTRILFWENWSPYWNTVARSRIHWETAQQIEMYVFKLHCEDTSINLEFENCICSLYIAEIDDILVWDLHT